MAVTERGLLIWQRNLSAATPIPWSDLTEPDGPPYGQLHWRDPDRGGRLTLTGVCGQGDVRRAVGQGRPTGRWTVRRVLGPAFGVVAVGLVCWLAGVPVASYLVLGERPDQLDDLARICNGGSAFRGSAPYRQAPGQPLVVFEHDQDDTEYEKFPVSTLDGASDDTAASVQLVACSRFVGRANRTPLQTCPYTGGVTWSTYQGRWRVDVYQARTGTRVTSRVLDGSTDTAECQSSVPHAEGTPRRVVLNTSPPYDAVLAH